MLRVYRQARREVACGFSLFLARRDTTGNIAKKGGASLSMHLKRKRDLESELNCERGETSKYERGNRGQLRLEDKNEYTEAERRESDEP